MDQHMYELPNMWAEYCDPKKRHLALTVEPDELGHWWLTSPWLGKRIYYAWISTPQDGFEAMRSGVQLSRQGRPSKVNYANDLPLDYWSPSARVAKLDEFGIDVSIALPQWGSVFANVPRGVGENLAVIRANLEAWNRRAVDVQAEGGGRLVSVGQVSLRGGDQDWLDSQLRLLSAGGV